QLRLMEIRPWHICKIKLCVCQLPEKEIRQSQLAACTDHQVRIRDSRRIKIILKDALIDLTRIQTALRHISGKFPYSAQNLVPAAVIQRNLEEQLVIIFGKVLQLSYFILDILVKSRYVSDHFYPHFVLLSTFHTFLQIAAEQLHQAVYFFPGSFPVLSGKSVNCKIFYSQIFDIVADAFQIGAAFYMAIASGHPFRLRPSAVSIQNNGDMIRYLHSNSSLPPDRRHPPFCQGIPFPCATEGEPVSQGSPSLFLMITQSGSLLISSRLKHRYLSYICL